MRFADLEKSMNLEHFVRYSVSQTLLVSVPFFWMKTRRNKKETNQQQVNEEKITILSSSYYMKKLKEMNRSSLFILDRWPDQCHHALFSILILVHSAIFGRSLRLFVL